MQIFPEFPELHLHLAKKMSLSQKDSPLFCSSFLENYIEKSLTLLEKEPRINLLYRSHFFIVNGKSKKDTIRMQKQDKICNHPRFILQK